MRITPALLGLLCALIFPAAQGLTQPAADGVASTKPSSASRWPDLAQLYAQYAPDFTSQERL